MKLTFKDYLLSEGIQDAGILKATFVVGIPGAGKSYTVKQLSGSISPKVVNTDKSTEFLSKKFDIPSNDQTWKTFFRDKTRPMTVDMLTNYVNGMLPLFVDGTSNDVSNILGRAGILESLGYDVGMVFVNTSLDVAKNRAEVRGKEIDRHVNMEFIEKVHALSQENKEYFKGKFSFFKEVNNNPGEFDDKAILQIYKQVAGFYKEPVANPVGKRTLDKLKNEKEKYLTPTIFSPEDLKKKMNGWYRA
jgi:hypothetical protein